MSPDEIREHVVQALHRVAPEADLSGLDPSQNLREALEIDSFDFLNVLIALQEKLGVEIPESDYRRRRVCAGVVQADASRHGADLAIPWPARSERAPAVARPRSRGGS